MVAEHTGIALIEGVELLFVVLVGVFIGSLRIGWLLVGVAVGDGVRFISGEGIGGLFGKCCADRCDGDWLVDDGVGCSWFDCFFKDWVAFKDLDGSDGGVVVGSNGGCVDELVGGGRGECFVGLVGCGEGELLGSANWTDLVLVDSTCVD